MYFTGKSKKLFLQKLNYEIESYPKGKNTNYELGTRLKEMIINTRDNIEYYE